MNQSYIALLGAAACAAPLSQGSAPEPRRAQEAFYELLGNYTTSRDSLEMGLRHHLRTVGAPFNTEHLAHIKGTQKCIDEALDASEYDERELSAVLRDALADIKTANDERIKWLSQVDEVYERHKPLYASSARVGLLHVGEKRTPEQQYLETKVARVRAANSKITKIDRRVHNYANRFCQH